MTAGGKPEDSVLLLVKAMEFATLKHAAQRRKGIQAEPYVNHLAEVARLLAEATGGTDPELVVAGFLHDTIEDTGTTYEELVDHFGADVADLVRETTDDKSLPKAERKSLQILHAHRISPRAKMLKIADKISNLRATLASPPVDWTLERKQEYFDWSLAVVAGCRGVNPALEAIFDAELARRDQLVT